MQVDEAAADVIGKRRTREMVNKNLCAQVGN